MSIKRNRRPGLFIAAEGIDGAGKTWALDQLREIAARIDGAPPVMLREPGSTPFGEELRALLTRHAVSASPVALALAFNASRRELVEKVIEPALSDNRTVITDRWTASTRVYQRDCPSRILEHAIEAAAGHLKNADLTLLFTRDPRAAVDSKIDEYGEQNRESQVQRLQWLQVLYLQQLRAAPQGAWIECPFSEPDAMRQHLEQIYRNAAASKR